MRKRAFLIRSSAPNPAGASPLRPQNQNLLIRKNKNARGRPDASLPLVGTGCQRTNELKENLLEVA